ncbi:hypothetical protein [Weissella bombi]|uniref:Uncharacterized protein n=1 Tax=Weissella bombi TaxID=1505725 RepID=A0A1C3ZRQ3_9LACO|nr:hypothetical protein [Weissella bombi]SCB85059.1 hypothetical protein GA0061074_102167 [Weissella bombi]
MKFAIIDGMLAQRQQLDVVVVANWLSNQVNKVIVLTDFMMFGYAKQLYQALQDNDDTWQFVQKESIVMMHKEKTFRSLERQLIGNGTLHIFDFSQMTVVVPYVDRKSSEHFSNQIEQISDYLYGQMKPMCLLPPQHIVEHLVTKGWRYANAQTNLGPITLTDATTTSKVNKIVYHNQPLPNSILLTLLN